MLNAIKASLPLSFRGKKGAKPGIIFETNLIICDENGEYTAETRRIYHIDGEN